MAESFIVGFGFGVRLLWAACAKCCCVKDVWVLIGLVNERDVNEGNDVLDALAEIETRRDVTRMRGTVEKE